MSNKTSFPALIPVVISYTIAATQMKKKKLSASTKWTSDIFQSLSSQPEKMHKQLIMVLSFREMNR